MGWMQKLYETYESCMGEEPDGAKPLMPISHTTQQAHIEVVIDGNGNFKTASVLAKGNDTTLIPCTEESGGRAGSKPVNHPLCDKLQYLAGDFVSYGGTVTSGYAKEPSEPHRLYLNMLSAWANSDFGHRKLNAILAYVKQDRLVADLVNTQILPVDVSDKSKLLKEWKGDKDNAPAIFKVLPTTQSPDSAFVRWRVEITDDPNPATWDDQELISAWINYYASQQTKTGLCLIKGDTEVLAIQHPAKLRNAGDKAKLISSNDTSGYTFRGRFLDADQAAGVGFDVTQKAHNALRWLIDRQAYKNGDQVIVAWAVAGKPVPDPFKDSLQLFLDSEEIAQSSTIESKQINSGDVGQTFALRLNRAIAGYRALLDPEQIVVMGLDSATPGRMAITFYRELKGSEFLERIETWHKQYAWLQNFGKDVHFTGAPSLRDIAEAAYGRRLDDKLRKSAVERLLPCIIDAQTFPNDLMQSVIRRACNRSGLEHWEWEKCLGIACSLFKGYSLSKQTEYQMSLESDRTTRDYLYGRLLAVADNIENYALTRAEKNRDTSAAKLMQRFADRPFSTWRTIELALAPYKSRLRSSENGAGFLHRREKLLDEILCAFKSDEFTKDIPLSGEFLLGYHCQRQKLWEKSETPANESNN
jgi:CRISPR-associated protein Csd1